ncbi:hydantoinase/oxoprolinase family protein [Paradesulfitobacterium ferrireducens]|uniref:hydantoinase/oxoprolinase family protein n=1 Tax=Paradesulfitobacterium ferrireducens TaxID=2816476 RepID=UPI001A8C684A|nr:hydantoinase/oxoprolinase family protein [Paradesulfitobacterium ferrireducens]
MKSIDIDVGGTFTDLVLRNGKETIIAKAPTTHYDLSVCFINVIEEAAKRLSVSLDELLAETKVIRYSTTVAMNRLIQRNGPKLGLVTTEGHEDMVLIGRGAQWVDGTRVAERRNLARQEKPHPLIARDLIVGIKERVDSTGKVIRPLDEEDLRAKIHYLVDKGVRGFVVSLLWSFVNPEHEKRVREIIREEYKEYHVGYLPVILASDVLGKLGEYQRTMTAILDAYLQRSLQVELSSTWDKIRAKGYKGTFLLIHNSGGCAEVFKTTASRTYNGGPVAGLIGSHYLAKQLGYKNVVASDVGGTSFDIGLVVEDSVRSYEFRPIVDRWMVGITMLQTLSIGAGGGSIAWINKKLGNRLEVGPQSAGSMPGPVCYNQGGTEPTVTDADLVLGYIDPDFYYGGRMKLNKDKAFRAIKNKIADPLGISVPEAASAIKRLVEESMASAIRKEVHLRGYQPEDFVVFAFGGGGPTHAAGYKGDIDKVVVFPMSPVFCAYGSSIMDMIHIYETSKRMVFMEPVTKKVVIEQEAFNEVVRSLMDKAKQELEGDGLNAERVIFSLELDMIYGGQAHVKRTTSPKLFIESKEDAQKIYEHFEKEFAESFSPLVVNPEGGVFVENFVLRAIIPTEKVNLPLLNLEGTDPAQALKGKREMYWDGLGFVPSEVYDFDALKPGNIVEGPAAAEAEYTTIVIPPTMRLTIDRHGLGILETNK